MESSLVSAIESIPGIQRFAGMDGAWEWSPSPMFKFTLVLAPGGNRVLQVNAREVFDDALVVEVLTFAQSADLDAAIRRRPISLLHGFRASSPNGFDAVGIAIPGVHEYYARRNELLQERVFAAFPAFSSEISGTESFDEARYRFKSMLHVARLDRGPAPFLKMRYNNLRTGSYSTNDGRGFATVDVLLREIELLADFSEGFVEFENFQGKISTVTWDASWIVLGENGSWAGTRDEVISWAKSFALEGER